METRPEFSHLKELPDCELCDPVEPWSLPLKAMFTVRFEPKGYELHICGTCLEQGVPREFIMEMPERP